MRDPYLYEDVPVLKNLFRRFNLLSERKKMISH